MNHPIAYVARLVSEYQRSVLGKLSRRSGERLVVCAGTFRDSSFKGLSRGPAQATDALIQRSMDRQPICNVPHREQDPSHPRES